MLISELEEKKILILGFGREGQDSFAFLRKKFPEKSIGIADKKEFEELPLETQRLLNADLKVVLYFGIDYLKQLHAYDVIVKSPGIPARVARAGMKKNHILTTQTNLFFANCPGTIIGITGTKGKSTTASFIAEVLKAAPPLDRNKQKKKVELVGNIEEPVLKFLDSATPDTLFVYELSSAQLELAEQSPYVAVFLNLYPEHLDFHGTMQAYINAKANITKFQTEDDYLIFNDRDESVAKIAASSKAKKLAFRPKKPKEFPFVASVEPAFLVGKIFDIPKEKIEKTLKRFQPLPHRLELVGTHRGIRFYNDSLATIPEATIAAFDTLGPNVQTLLAGGFDRGVPMEKLADRILQSKVRTLILFPATGNVLWKEIEKLAKKQEISKLPTSFSVNNMATAVQLAYEHTPKEGICLLSPAAASFTLFRDYKERGEEFRKYVKFYAQKKHS